MWTPICQEVSFLKELTKKKINAMFTKQAVETALGHSCLHQEDGYGSSRRSPPGILLPPFSTWADKEEVSPS